MGKKVEYVFVAYVRLCFDVIGDVLQFGTRRHLSAFERIGRHFHAVIAERFAVKPFLALTLQALFDWPVMEKDKGYDDRHIFSEYGSENIKAKGELIEEASA